MLLRPDLLLRAESLFALALSLVVYHANFPHHWLFFSAVFFLPDLSLALYAIASLRLAALCYNLLHTLAVPVALALAGVLFSAPLACQVALIWAAHIFMDRALGYGLKFPQAFQPTHIQSAAHFTGSASPTASSRS